MYMPPSVASSKGAGSAGGPGATVGTDKADLANLMTLQSVYPEFAGVELPAGSMEMLKK